MTTTTSNKVELTLLQSIGNWTNNLLADESNSVARALSAEEKKHIKELLDGTLRDTVVGKLSNAIDQQAMLGKLQQKQADFATLMKKVPTVDAIVGHLLDRLEESVQPGMEKLKKLALSVVDWLYSIIESIIKFLRNLDVSRVLPDFPDWTAKHVNDGKGTNAVAFFLALPASKLKELLDAASSKT